MNFYLVTTTGHGLFGAHYYSFSLLVVCVALGCIVGTTVGCTLFLRNLFGRD
jgi:hypothetical protein